MMGRFLGKLFKTRVTAGDISVNMTLRVKKDTMKFLVETVILS
jgi:hypothetical protein